MENGVTKVECNTDTQKLEVRLQEIKEEELEARLKQERDIWRDKLETLQAQCEGGLQNITTK